MGKQTALVRAPVAAGAGVVEMALENEIDEKKRGTKWYKELTPSPSTKGGIYDLHFTAELITHNIDYILNDKKFKRDGGDDGWDCMVGPLFIDVKGTDYPPEIACLLVEEGHVKSHIFVMFSTHIAIGWAFNYEVLRKTPRLWPHKVNHKVPGNELRPMSELWELLQKLQYVKPAPHAGGEGD